MPIAEILRSCPIALSGAKRRFVVRGPGSSLFVSMEGLISKPEDGSTLVEVRKRKNLCAVEKNMVFAWWYWFIHPAQCPIIAVLDASVISLPDSSVVHNGPQLIICEVSSMIMNHVNDPPPLPLSIKFIPAGAGSHDSWAQSRKHSKSEKKWRANLNNARPFRRSTADSTRV